MLVLSRKRGESIVIDGHILVTVERIDGNQVRLGITAPTNVPIHRAEVEVKIRQQREWDQ
jgi:carbon storage regulator